MKGSIKKPSSIIFVDELERKKKNMHTRFEESGYGISSRERLNEMREEEYERNLRKNEYEHEI